MSNWSILSMLFSQRRSCNSVVNKGDNNFRAVEHFAALKRGVP